MWLKKTANFIGTGLSPIVTVAGYIGAGVIALMMLLTVADVVGRGFLNKPVLGAYEISEFMLVIVVFISMASCQLLKGHITIDLVVDRLRKRTQNIIDSIMYFLFLIMFCVFTWQLFVYAMEETGGTVSGILDIPVFPFIYIASLGSALVSLVVFMHLIQFLAGAISE